MILGIGAPLQAVAVQALTDWPAGLKGYNLLMAAVTATLVALWWLVRLIRFIFQTYQLFFGPIADRPRHLRQDERDDAI